MSDLSAFVLAIAKLADRLAEFGRVVQKSADVGRVGSGVAPHLYESGPAVEGYVDAELPSGNAITWWMVIEQGENSWTVSTSVLHDTIEGQDELCELPTRYALEAGELAREIGSAAEALLAAIPIGRLQEL